MLDSPCLLVLKTLLEVGLGALVLSRDPKEDVPVVAGAGERLSWRAVRNGVAMNWLCGFRTSWAPPNDVYSLRMLDEG